MDMPKSPDSPIATAAIARELTVPDLVAQVYEEATDAERGKLLEQLMRPLSVLSLVAIADGAFADLCLQSRWRALSIRLEDIRQVRGSHVAALVEHAHQVSADAIEGVAGVLSASPGLSGTAAAVLLMALLMERARRGGQYRPVLPRRDQILQRG